LIVGKAPEALADLDAPDAVFIGGGLSEPVFDACWSALRPLGRLVAIRLHRTHGGMLAKIAVSRAEPVGSMSGWRPFMSVTQWSLEKR